MAHVDVQHKTFLRWINAQLQTELSDLTQDLSDGVILWRLLNSLALEHWQWVTSHKSNRDLPPPKPSLAPLVHIAPRFLIHALDNITAMLEYLRFEAKMQPHTIGAQNIVEGDLKLILGFLWLLFLHYTSLRHPPNCTNRETLLAWCQSVVEVPIKSFSLCWKDGNAFMQLCTAVSGCEGVYPTAPASRLEYVFQHGSAQLGITRLLDVEDLTVESPDERCVITYVYEWYKYHQQYPHGPPERAELPSAYTNKATQFLVRVRTLRTQWEELVELGMMVMATLPPASSPISPEMEKTLALAIETIRVLYSRFDRACKASLREQKYRLLVLLRDQCEHAQPPAAALSLEAIEAEWEYLESVEGDTTDGLYTAKRATEAALRAVIRFYQTDFRNGLAEGYFRVFHPSRTGLSVEELSFKARRLNRLRRLGGLTENMENKSNLEMLQRFSASRTKEQETVLLKRARETFFLEPSLAPLSPLNQEHTLQPQAVRQPSRGK